MNYQKTFYDDDGKTIEFINEYNAKKSK
ncbi:DUF2963 domain-containing protein [Candidatus Phytoplasma australiense]|nr:DUF2963 domain-containing protein [Candidatus Phytoplasma australiense]